MHVVTMEYIYYHFTPWEFFQPVLTGDFSLSDSKSPQLGKKASWELHKDAPCIWLNS